MKPVRRIDRHEYGTYLRGGKLGNDPLRIVCYPDPYMFALLNSEADQATRDPIALIAELRVRVAHIVFEMDERVAVAEL